MKDWMAALGRVCTVCGAVESTKLNYIASVLSQMVPFVCKQEHQCTLPIHPWSHLLRTLAPLHKSAINTNNSVISCISQLKCIHQHPNLTKYWAITLEEIWNWADHLCQLCWSALLCREHIPQNKQEAGRKALHGVTPLHRAYVMQSGPHYSGGGGEDQEDQSLLAHHNHSAIIYCEEEMGNSVWLNTKDRDKSTTWFT